MAEDRVAASVLDPPRRMTVCHRYGVEAATGLLEMGRVWGEERAETLRRVRELPTYDRATDTVVVCWYVDA